MTIRALRTSQKGMVVTHPEACYELPCFSLSPRSSGAEGFGTSMMSAQANSSLSRRMPRANWLPRILFMVWPQRWDCTISMLYLSTMRDSGGDRVAALASIQQTISRQFKSFQAASFSRNPSSPSPIIPTGKARELRGSTFSLQLDDQPDTNRFYESDP